MRVVSVYGVHRRPLPTYQRSPRARGGDTRLPHDRPDHGGVSSYDLRGFGVEYMGVKGVVGTPLRDSHLLADWTLSRRGSFATVNPEDLKDR